MNMMNIYGSRGVGSISLDEYVRLADKARSGEPLGTFEKLWDAIKDLVRGTHVGQAKELLLSILSEGTTDWVRLEKFRELQWLIREPAHTPLQEVAHNDGVSIRIMSSLSRRAHMPKTICLFEKFIPHDHVDIANSMRSRSGTQVEVSYASIASRDYVQISGRSSLLSPPDIRETYYDADDETGRSQALRDASTASEATPPRETMFFGATLAPPPSRAVSEGTIAPSVRTPSSADDDTDYEVDWNAKCGPSYV